MGERGQAGSKRVAAWASAGQGAAHLECRLLHAVLPAGALLRHEVGGAAEHIGARALAKTQLVAHPAGVAEAQGGLAHRAREAGRSRRAARRPHYAESTKASMQGAQQPESRGCTSAVGSQSLQPPPLRGAHRSCTCLPAGMRFLFRKVPCVDPGSRTNATPSMPRNCTTACSLQGWRTCREDRADLKSSSAARLSKRGARHRGLRHAVRAAQLPTMCGTGEGRARNPYCTGQPGQHAATPPFLLLVSPCLLLDGWSSTTSLVGARPNV